MKTITVERLFTLVSRSVNAQYELMVNDSLLDNEFGDGVTFYRKTSGSYFYDINLNQETELFKLLAVFFPQLEKLLPTKYISIPPTSNSPLIKLDSRQKLIELAKANGWVGNTVNVAKLFRELDNIERELNKW